MNPTGSPQKIRDYVPRTRNLGDVVDSTNTADKIAKLFDGMNDDMPPTPKRKKKGKKGKKSKQAKEEEEKVDDELAGLMAKTKVEEAATPKEEEHMGDAFDVIGKDQPSLEDDLFADLREEPEEDGEEDGEEDEDDDEEEVDEAVVPGMNVRLLPHQVRGLRFLRSREEGKGKGGLLADDVSVCFSPLCPARFWEVSY